MKFERGDSDCELKQFYFNKNNSSENVRGITLND